MDDPAHQRNKIAPRWTGPYEVMQPLAPSDSFPPVTFLVRDLSRPGAKPKVIHYNRTKPFISDPSQPLRYITPSNKHQAHPTTLSGFLPSPSLPATPTFAQHPLIHPPTPQRPQHVPTDDAVSAAGPTSLPSPMPSADPPSQLDSRVATRSLPSRARRLPCHLQDFELS